jgi:hypothetical protein
VTAAESDKNIIDEVGLVSAESGEPILGVGLEINTVGCLLYFLAAELTARLPDWE